MLPLKSSAARLRIAVTFAALFAPSLAFAHPGHDHGSFQTGLSHPVLGLDHLLAMVAVGLWAVQLGGRAVWIVPATFVSVMSAGAVLGAAGVSLSFVEQGILASILILGILLAIAVRPPVWASAVVVGLLAGFHGFAHGAEMPATASGLAYGAGFVLATLALHACGIGFGRLAANLSKTPAIRLAGAAICLAGVMIAFR